MTRRPRPPIAGLVGLAVIFGACSIGGTENTSAGDESAVAQQDAETSDVETESDAPEPSPSTSEAPAPESSVPDEVVPSVAIDALS